MSSSGSPQAPSQPTVQNSVSDYIQNYPALFNLQQQYGPQEAQQQVNLAQQYAQPLAQAYKSAQDALYPEQAKITQSLADQAMAGMTSAPPQWMQDQYRSNVNAQLGSNAASPLGADYMSRGLLQQQQDWQNYYRQLGSSISGQQPIQQAQAPQTNNILAGYTPQGVMNYNAQGYNTAANIYGTQMQNQGNSPWMNAIGSLAGGALGSVGGPIGSAIGSKLGSNLTSSWH